MPSAPSAVPFNKRLLSRDGMAFIGLAPIFAVHKTNLALNPPLWDGMAFIGFAPNFAVHKTNLAVHQESGVRVIEVR